MALSLIERGSIQGPRGPKGDEGDPGPPGATLDPEGTVPTKADLLSLSPEHLQTWVVVENKHLYVYEGDEGPSSGDTGYDADLPGWTDMGEVQGPKGEPGEPGEQGPQGAPGGQGAPGAKGDQGDQGLQGVPGTPGEQGSAGEQGPAGPTGDPGARGADGPQGPKGDKGDTGSKGDTGAQGNPGSTGAAGSKIYAYNGTSGRTQEGALASAVVGDVLVDLDTGNWYDVADL